MTHEWAPFSGRSGLPILLSAWGLTREGVEVGTHRGEFAHTVLHNWPGVLHCVDPWSVPEGYEEGAKTLLALDGSGNREDDYRQCIERLRVFGERGRLLRTTSCNALGLFPSDSLDFVYVDGDHHPEMVAFDIRNWWQRIRPGGILAGHDYFTPNDPTGQPGRGVAGAVDYFAETRGLTVFVIREVWEHPWSWYLVKPVPPPPPEPPPLDPVLTI